MPLLWNGESERLDQWTEGGQIALCTVLALFANLASGLMILPFGFTDAREVQAEIVLEQGHVVGMLLVALFAPFVETAYGQIFPIVLARMAKRPTHEAILWSAIWFAVLHIQNGPAHVFQTFFVGWVLGATLIYGWRHSLFKAYRMTFLTHAFHNTFVFGLYLIIEYFQPEEMPRYL